MSEFDTLFKYHYNGGHPTEDGIFERFSNHTYTHEADNDYDPIKVSKLKEAIKKYVKETEYNLEYHLYRCRIFDFVSSDKDQYTPDFIHAKALEDAEKRQDLLFAEFEKTVIEIDPSIRD